MLKREGYTNNVRARSGKIIIITRKTMLEELLARYQTLGQAQFYLEHSGEDFSAIERDDRIYRDALSAVEQIAMRHAPVQRVDRSRLPNMLFAKTDVVIAIGQDGLIANTLKYLDGQPLLGVNPDPERIEGVLLPFVAGDIERVLPAVLKQRFHARQITMAEAVTRDGQRLLAANDFFIGARTHVSACYEISLGQQKEIQSSSGIIVSTGLGATGWMSSVMTQASRIAERNGFGQIPYEPPAWETESLQFVVREPFPGKAFGTSLVYGIIESGSHLHLTSRMPGNGALFSDGMEDDAIEFRSGMTVRIGVAKTKGVLVSAA